MYHIVLRVRLQVLLPEMLQDSHLDERLMMESLFVPARTVLNEDTTQRLGKRTHPREKCTGSIGAATTLVAFFFFSPP